MKTFKLLAVFASLFITGLFTSCNQEYSSPRDYVDYISRYTPGHINKNGTIWFEIVSPRDSIQPLAPVPAGIITISPKVKGTTYWRNNRIIEFRPDDGQLLPGRKYSATLHLDKLYDVKGDAAKFVIPIEIEKLRYEAYIDNYTLTSRSPDASELSGVITVSEQVETKYALKAITARQNGRVLPVVVESSTDMKSHRFKVSGIRRSDNTGTISVLVDGKSMGSDQNLELTESVPASGFFGVHRVRTVMEPVPVVEIMFTDELDTEQDMRGLFVANNSSTTITNIKVDRNKVRLSGDFPSQGDINIVAGAGIRSRAGTILGSDASYDVSFSLMPPSIKILRGGNIMPNAQDLYLPVETRNLKAVTVTIKQIFENNIPYFLQDNRIDGTYRVVNYGRTISKERIELPFNDALDRNVSKVNTLDLAKMFERSPGSIYRIRITSSKEDAVLACGESEGDQKSSNDDEYNYSYGYDSDEESDDDEYLYYSWRDRDNPCTSSFYRTQELRPAINLFATNIGLVAKANSSFSELTVIANNILTTDAISGAKIDLYDYQNQHIGGGQTNNEGYVTIPCKDIKPYIIIAQSGKERGFLTVLDGQQLSTSRFDAGGKEIQKGIKGYAYGERGVWRPGDHIYLTFILDDSEQPLPANHPLTLKLYNPLGQFVSQHVRTEGLNGFYHFDLETKSDAPTGMWSAVISVGGVTFTKNLRIETVKPNRLKINLALDKQNGKPLTNNINGDLTVSWLQGAIGANLHANIKVHFKQAATAFKGLEKYEFNSSVERFEPSEVTIFDSKVNSEGKARISYQAGNIDNAPGMLRAEFVTIATEPGGDFSTYVQNELYSPYSSYVGIATPPTPKYEVLETDKKHCLELVTVNSVGEATSNIPVNLQIYRVDWRWWWSSSREDLSYYVSRSNASPIIDTQVTTNGQGKVSYDFQVNYPDWGRYLIVATNQKSGHRSSQVVHIDWPSWRGASSQKDPEGLTMLSFTTDKEEYSVGQKVKVTIPKSSDGSAIISLETGSSVLKFWRVRTGAEKNTETSFDVTTEMAPNIYINVTLLQPYKNESNDLPVRLYGLKNISVTDPGSKLQPVLTMSDVLRPEQPFAIKVKEAKGKQMTYTLAIVDEGLLDLTAFRTPNAWNDFFARRAHGVKSWDLYDNIMGRFSGSFGTLYSIGGSDEVLNTSKQSTRFVPVVRYIGPFHLKSGGENLHRMQLPPYIGSVRVMVVAGAKGAYGSTDKTVPVRSPLMTLTTLPRVLGPGEEVLMPVNVFAIEDNIRNAKISIQPNDMFEVLTPLTQEITIDKSGEQLVLFRLRIKDKIGQASVKITARSGNESSSETINIEVRNPNPEVITQLRQTIAAGQSATLPYDLLVNNSDNWINFEAASGVQVDLSRRLDYLTSYPHGCSEQITSGAMPQLYIDNFINLSEEREQKIQNNITYTINEMYSRQTSSGGIAYWPGSTSPDEWITSYVGQFMYEAKSKGYSVMSSFVNSWTNYQKQLASRWTNTGNHYSQMMQAYRLYTLAMWGAADMGAMNRLKESVELVPQARWHLAMAYAIAGRKEAATELLLNQPTTFERYSPYNPTYGSSERDMATALECLMLLGRTDEAMKTARSIADALNRSNEYSTQTIAMQLLALSKFAKMLDGGAIAIDVEQTGNQKGSLTSKNRPMVMVELPTTPVKGEVKVSNKGESNLYVTLTSRTIPLVDNSPAISQGISMNVSYIGTNKSPVDPTSLAQGTDFTAEVTVTNTSAATYYTNIALTQIFPSGWEILNERLLSSQADELSGTRPASHLSYQDIRDDRVMSYFNVGAGKSIKITVKLRATYKGRFFMPAYLCKAMYDNSVEARTTGRWVEVK